ncbi:hypothetical protein WQ56_15640 [Luteimonas sp. FCS-9]|nr:hypothetical protein WQ56_15640 [Luteimonas sp. FCS-9]
MMGAVSAAEPTGIAPAELLNFEQALDVDVIGTANALNITPEQARSRLNVEFHAGDLAERIRSEHKDRVAGIYIEHEPESRLVVRLTGHEAIRPEFHQFGADRLEVAYELGAEHTFAELQRWFDSFVPKLHASLTNWQGGYVDERTGEIVLYVLRSENVASVSDIRQSIERSAGVPVRIVELETPNVNQAVYGSGHLSYQLSGTWYVCTGAFVVQHPSTNRYGLLTAGHCAPSNNIFEYTGIDSAFHTLTHVARLDNSTVDLGWMTGGAGTTYGPWFYANAWRQLTGRRTQANTPIGAQICRYGRNGGYGCATVRSTSHNPGSACGPNGTQPCASTYVGLDSAAGLCQGGDSGGPWFISTVAAGVHKSGNPTAGLCTYTSTDYAYSQLALQFLY